MRKITLTLLFSAWSVGLLWAQPKQFFTNTVPLTEEMRLSITDSRDVPIGTASNGEQIPATRRLYWSLQNVSSNQWSSIIFLGMSNSFDFKLETTSGVAIPKTERGKAMSVGPKSLTDLSS